VILTSSSFYFAFPSSPLHLSVRGNHAKIVSLLLDFGAEPNVLDSYNVTPLHWYASLSGIQFGTERSELI
jgi:ankyrin repeat protein